MKRLLRVIVVIAALAGGSAHATPQLLSLNAPVTGSSFYNAGNGGFGFAKVTDGRTGDSGSAGDWSFWLSSQGDTAGAFVQIDLGQVNAITSLVVQNTHNRAFNDRGSQDFTLRVSSNGVAFTTVVASTFSASDWTNLVDRTFPIATSGRYVRFTAVGPNPCFGCSGVGLNELSVYGTAALAVPEPSTLALVFAGLTGIALARRRVSAAHLP